MIDFLETGSQEMTQQIRLAASAALCSASGTGPTVQARGGLENEDFSPLRPLVDWLSYNGYRTVTKIAKEYTDSEGRRKIKGNMAIELAIDAMELAPRLDHAVLFSGDGDFSPLVDALQRQGVRVSIVSTIRGQTPMASDALRRQADNFIELAELRDVIGRPARSDQG